MRVKPPTKGDIYRIKKRADNGIGPPFIRIISVNTSTHALLVIDYMADGELAGNRWKDWRGPRHFDGGASWSRLLKYWRRIK